MDDPLTKGEVAIAPLEEGDLDAIVDWRNDPEYWRCFFNKEPLSHARQKGWFQGLLKDSSRQMFSIRHRGQAVGTIGLSNIDHADQKAEYGNVLVDRKLKGQKIAYQASVLLLGYCFDVLNLHRVYLHVFEDNAAAIGLYERCGFQREGLLREAVFSFGERRNVVVMGILEREFRAARAR